MDLIFKPTNLWSMPNLIGNNPILYLFAYFPEYSYYFRILLHRKNMPVFPSIRGRQVFDLVLYLTFRLWFLDEMSVRYETNIFAVLLGVIYNEILNAVQNVCRFTLQTDFTALHFIFFVGYSALFKDSHIEHQ